jgi:hypothetical protein
VGRRRVRGPQRGHHLLRSGAVRHRLHAGDEAALLDDSSWWTGAVMVWGMGAALGAETKTPTVKVGVFAESLVGRAGFEPATNGLKVRCSTS